MQRGTEGADSQNTPGSQAITWLKSVNADGGIIKSVGALTSFFMRLTMLARQKSVNLSLGVRALAILLYFCASLCAEHAHILWTRGGSIPSNVSVAYSPDGRLTASGGGGGGPGGACWARAAGMRVPHASSSGGGAVH